MTGWLTIDEAAKCVGRSPNTIYRWARQKLITILAGRVLERQLLEAETKRQSVGRPRATRSKSA